MLQTNTVDKRTLELLENFCEHKNFNDFYLVGGTALALQIGHRKSIDLDFFSKNPFHQDSLKQILINEFNAQILGLAENAITGVIDSIKFDFITHQYQPLKPLNMFDNIRLSSLEDIAAMKLNAVRNRGSKKDFVDIYFLLEKFSLSQLLKMVNEKYPNHVDILTLKSLVYFEDADKQPNCDMIIHKPWNEIKEKLQQEVLQFL